MTASPVSPGGYGAEGGMNPVFSLNEGTTMRVEDMVHSGEDASVPTEKTDSPAVQAALANERWPTLTVAEVESMRADANGAQGYRNAFYELAQMLELPAMPISPREAWETRMKPALQAVLPGFRYMAAAGDGDAEPSTAGTQRSEVTSKTGAA